MPRALAAMLVASLALSALPPRALAQSSEFTPTPDGQWEETRNLALEGEEDDKAIALAAKALAADNPREARDIIQEWLDNNERSSKPQVPAALLIRADANLALDSETKSLYDYERIIKKYPQTEQYVAALERELMIASQYVRGRKRKFLGMRIEPAGEMGIEMLIRVQERLPGSSLAERAAIEMADYYFRQREMGLAAESYDLYVRNYPNGPNRLKAMERRIYSSIARFRGPEHDASGLIDAKEQIRVFAMQYPAEAEQQGLDSALVTRLDESAAAQRLNSAQWYLNSGDLPSGRLFLRRVIAKHPQTAAAQRAKEILAERGWDQAPPPPPGVAPPPPQPPAEPEGPARTPDAPPAAPAGQSQPPSPPAGAEPKP